VVVPSGNLGNVTAGLLARRAGAPLGPLVAACNRNDALVRFETDGETREVPVTPTASSAMDVGRPSNLERLEDLCGHDARALARAVPAVSASEEETREAMAWASQDHGVLLDPHTAVGVAAVRRGGLPGSGVPTVLATAHPAKFPDAVRAATGRTPELPPGALDSETPERMVRLDGDLGALATLLEEAEG
jgi:threonine synthase